MYRRFFPILLSLLFIFPVFPQAPVGSGIPEAEYQALQALYSSTDGDNWTNNTNWLSEEPVNNWYGVTVVEGRVSQLELSSNQLTGVIPPELGILTNLEWLLLSDSNLTGAIPAGLGNLTNLFYLDLSSNQLTGGIPVELGSLANLGFLYLDSNNLTGSIPPELGNLSSLTILSLSYNQLTGEIPGELGNLTNLLHLHLYNNQLTGEIPVELGNLINLEGLLLQYNRLTGSVPAELGNLTELHYLLLYNNFLSGDLPLFLATPPMYVNLSNNFLYASIPAVLAAMDEKHGGDFMATQNNLPLKAISPAPLSGAMDQSIQTDPSWADGGGSETYDVYFGTSPTPGTGEFQANTSGTSFNPGTLAYSTTYYWRIDAKNPGGTTEGDVWSFTTMDDPSIPGSIGAYDFDGDGDPDILWRNVSSGANLIWVMNGAVKESTVWLDPMSVEWDLKGAADFDGDGNLDLLWHNRDTGDNLAWFMDGTSKVGEIWYPNSAPQYIIESLTDLDNDGCADLLLRNNETGANLVWLLDGSGRKEKRWFRSLSIAWKILAVADFNWDGYPDILWQHVPSGVNMFWTMDGAEKTSRVWLTITQPEWKFNLGDFNADGGHDILWHHQGSGVNMAWGMIETERDPGRWREWLTITENQWDYAVNADFSGDSHPDILWHNVETGANMLWCMNDFVKGERVWLNTMADTNFKLITEKKAKPGAVIFAEDFSDGLTGWSEVYSATNYVVDVYNRTGVFYNNESGAEWGGIVTDGTINIQPGVSIEAEVYSYDEVGSTSTLQLTLTQKAGGEYDWDCDVLAEIDALGLAGLAGSWRTVKVEVIDGYYCKLYIDGIYLGTSTGPIPEAYRGASYLWIKCWSSSADGARVYLDQLEVRE